MRIQKFISIFLLCSVFIIIHSPLWSQANQSLSSELTIWTYDSFVSEWGPASLIANSFEKKYGIKLRFISKGDGGALLASLLDTSRKPSADVVIGLDDQQIGKALARQLFIPLQLKNIDQIPKNLRIDMTDRLIPYDYGQFAFIWDSESGIEPPQSLEDLTKPLYRKKIIIMDPRTSTPGLGFLAWTEAVYKTTWKDYWKRLSPSILAMTPSWDTGYGLFTKGEVPLVLSYSTSPAYHKAYENSERYKALNFKEGHPMQIEFAGVLATSLKRDAAQKFIDFLISAECQAVLPETQWMFPANASIKLPPSFKVAEKFPALSVHLFDINRDPSEAARILSENP